MNNRLFLTKLQDFKIRINLIHIQLYFKDEEIRNLERFNDLTKVTYNFSQDCVKLDPNPDILTAGPVPLPLSHSTFKSNSLGEREGAHFP